MQKLGEIVKIFSTFVQVCETSTHITIQKRSLFMLHGRTKKYHDRKLVGYSCEQIYEVVADVENYKYFVPFCKRSDILYRGKNSLKGALEIGFPPISESYTSTVTFSRPYLVKAVCVDGKLFNHLTTTWIFSRGLRSNPLSCIIDFSIDFEFKSLLHSNVASVFFDKLVKQMEKAFLVEAKKRYGTETLPSHPLLMRKS